MLIELRSSRRRRAAGWPGTGLALAVLGGLCLAAGLGLLVREIEFGLNAVSAAGRVERLQPLATPFGQAQAIVVEFVTAHGLTVQVVANAGHYPPARGESVSVLYRPSDPRHARIDRFEDCWLYPLALTVIGTAVIPLGLHVRQHGLRAGPSGY